MPGAAAIQQRIFYSGNVQGVGFRATVRRIAQGYNVTGFVRNLADGGVELVAEGDPKILKQFATEISQTMSDYIRTAESQTRPATGQWSAFQISR